jgi:ferrochelatase
MFCRRWLLVTFTVAAGFTPPRIVGRQALHAARHAVSPEMKLLSPTVEFDDFAAVDHSPVGVLLLSVGAPETPDDVEEYLYNVFCDPEIRTLPPALSWAFKRPLAWFIAKDRAEEARASMMRAGGRSPQLSTIQAQAKALQTELEDRGVSARTFIAMRYWHPFAEDAIEMIKAEGIQKLVILPLYPQFSLSTSGSALRVLERMLYTDPDFPVKSSVVPAWYNRPGFLEATAKGIVETIRDIPEELQGEAHILYTAQGLPRKYVEDLNDPYQEQVERSIELVRAELAKLGVTNKDSLSYQGAFGPTQLRWLEPSTTQQIGDLAGGGVRTLVLVPISFVFEHMATLNEMDREFAELARASGVTTFRRVPTLGTNPEFVDALANVVLEALPDLSRPSMQQINEGNPVSLNMVNEYTRLYTKDQLQLVPQESPWGFTENAEIINGRIAMAAVTAATAFTLDPTLKAVAAAYRAARDAVS